MIQPVLIVAVLFGSTLSGVIGMGGGVVLLAVMATLLEPATVVPLHGLIQMITNSTRTFALLRHVAWWVVGLYTPAMFIGVFLGLRVYAGAGMPWFRPLIGAFVLSFLLWDRLKPKRLQLPRWVFVPAGLVGGSSPS